MKILQRIIIAVSLGSALHGALSQQVSNGAGNISGTIIYPNDTPASGFVVMIVGASATATPKSQGFTDRDGKFSVSGLSYGDYVVAPYSVDENAGYPLTLFRFYDQDPDRVRLSEASHNANTRVKLGKPAIILTGRIFQSKSGTGIRAQIALNRLNDPDSNLRFASAADGFYRVPLPAGVAVEMAISAPGFQPVRRTITPEPSSKNLTIDVSLFPTN